METIQEEMEEKKQSGWTKILLILNFIIWAIIVFMAIIFNGVVKAQGMNMTSWNYRDANDTWTSYGNGTTQALVAANAIGFNFDNSTGNNNGVVYLEADVIGAITTGDINVTWWTDPTNNGTGAVSKNCTVTNTNLLTNHLKCQFNFTITNNSTNIRILTNFANARSMNNVTVSGYTDVQPTNNATTADIVNQTIQITNQIMQSVQDSIENVEDRTGDIIYTIESAISDATNTIIGRDSLCEEETINHNYEDATQLEAGFLKSDGTIQNDRNWFHTDYIKVSIGQIKLDYKTYWETPNICIYDINKNLITCHNYTLGTHIDTYTITTESYVRYSVSKETNSYYNLTYVLCKDRLKWILENQNSNTNRIIDRLYQDHQEQLEQLTGEFIRVTPDESDFENMEDIEDDLHQYTNVDLSSFNVDIDTSSANWVWNTLTSLLNTSALVFGMIISILSIGLIKLVLNR